MKKGDKLPNIHPGEVLLEEFLKPMAISQNALARAIDVPPRRINEIVLKKRAITADTALRLARAFYIRTILDGLADRLCTGRSQGEIVEGSFESPSGYGLRSNGSQYRVATLFEVKYSEQSEVDVSLK